MRTMIGLGLAALLFSSTVQAQSHCSLDRQLKVGFDGCGSIRPDFFSTVAPTVVDVNDVGGRCNGGSDCLCRGVLLPDGFVLTANHCVPAPGGIQVVNPFTGDAVSGSLAVSGAAFGADIALIALSASDTAALVGGGVRVGRVRVLDKVGVSADLVMDFGASFLVIHPVVQSSPPLLRFDSSETIAGDSGSPVLDKDGYVVGVHSFGAVANDPGGAVYLTPFVNGQQSTNPGLSDRAEPVVTSFGTPFSLRTGSLAGSVVWPFAATSKQVGVLVDGVMALELASLLGSTWYWTVPARYRDGTVHTYQLVAIDPSVSAIGPNANAFSEQVVSGSISQPTGNFVLDIQTGNYSATYFDADTPAVLGRVELCLCSSAPFCTRSQCVDITSSMSPSGSGNWNANLVVPPGFWTGSGSLYIRRWDTEDPDFSVSSSLVSFPNARPTGQGMAICRSKSTTSRIESNGWALDYLPFVKSVSVALEIDGFRVQVRLSDVLQSGAFSFLPWPTMRGSSHRVRLLAFDPGRLLDLDYGAVLFDEYLVCP